MLSLDFVLEPGRFRAGDGNLPPRLAGVELTAAATAQYGDQAGRQEQSNGCGSGRCDLVAVLSSTVVGLRDGAGFGGAGRLSWLSGAGGLRRRSGVWCLLTVARLLTVTGLLRGRLGGGGLGGRFSLGRVASCGVVGLTVGGGCLRRRMVNRVVGVGEDPPVGQLQVLSNLDQIGIRDLVLVLLVEVGPVLRAAVQVVGDGGQ